MDYGKWRFWFWPRKSEFSTFKISQVAQSSNEASAPEHSIILIQNFWVRVSSWFKTRIHYLGHTTVDWSYFEKLWLTSDTRDRSTLGHTRQHWSILKILQSVIKYGILIWRSPIHRLNFGNFRIFHTDEFHSNLGKMFLTFSE